MIDNSAGTFVRMTFVLKADVPEWCVLTATARTIVFVTINCSKDIFSIYIWYLNIFLSDTVQSAVILAEVILTIFVLTAVILTTIVLATVFLTTIVLTAIDKNFV